MAIRVYVNTSVYKGAVDLAINAASQECVTQDKAGSLQWVVSEIVVDELQEAAERGRQVYEEHLPWTEFVSVSVGAVRLRDAYLKAGVVTTKWATDALHVALPSVHRYRGIVIWNFKHIVRFEKTPLYHGVNLINGVESLSINPPAEVITYEN